MLMKWVSEKQLEGKDIGMPKFLRFGTKKRHLGKGLFLFLEDILLKKKKKSACSTTPVITKYWLLLGKGNCIT